MLEWRDCAGVRERKIEKSEMTRERELDENGGGKNTRRIFFSSGRRGWGLHDLAAR